MQLLGGWVRHARRLAPDVDRVDLAVGLLARYDQPHRAYHDARHLAEVVAAVALLAEHADDLSCVVLAAWWHDAVYVVGADDNEAASAELARQTLTGWDVDPIRVAHVGDLVRVTAGHEAGADADAQVLCDADLAVLASPQHRYDAYAADVRREWAAVPDEAFGAGRAQVLRGLLDHDPLYRTSSARERWEVPARRNVEHEISLLLGRGRDR
jgi:predicted metal-dependent HD superfamily phosphohydrolase